MGGRSIEGSFITGNVYKEFYEKIFMTDLQNGYNTYSGTIGTIRDIDKVEAFEFRDKKYVPNNELNNFMEKNPSLKNKEEIFKEFLRDKCEYIDKAELRYVVDHSSHCGYEIVTYGGRQELDVSNIYRLPEIWLSKLEPNKKGYKVFMMYPGYRDAMKSNNKKSNYGYYKEYNFDTLQDIEDQFKKDVYGYGNSYFIIKNDKTKLYVMKPNIKVVEKTNKRSWDKDATYSVHLRYPVYYYGMAWC